MSLIVSHRPAEKSLTSHPSLEGETSDTRDASPRRVTLWLVGRLAAACVSAWVPLAGRHPMSNAIEPAFAGDHSIGHRTALLQGPELLGSVAAGTYQATVGRAR